MCKNTRISFSEDSNRKAIIHFGTSFPCPHVAGKRIVCGWKEHVERGYGGTERQLYWKSFHDTFHNTVYAGWRVCCGSRGYVKGCGEWRDGKGYWERPKWYGPVVTVVELARQWNKHLRPDIAEQHDRWGNCHLCHHLYGVKPKPKSNCEYSVKTSV